MSADQASCEAQLAINPVQSDDERPIWVARYPALIALMGPHNLYLLAPEFVTDDSETLRVVG